jgi:hypothetical protein
MNNLILYEKMGLTQKRQSFSGSMEIDFFKELYSFLVAHSELEILINDLLCNKACNSTFFEILNNKTILYDMINNSGKGFTDIGLEEECENNDLYYLFLEIKVNLTKYLNETEYLYLYRFLEQSSFFTGLCIPKQCLQFFTNFVNKEKNEKFFQYLDISLGINMITNYSVIEPKQSKSFMIIFFMIITYLIVKFTISLFGFIIFKIFEEQDRLTTTTSVSEEDDLDESTLSNAINQQLHTETFLFTTRKKKVSVNKRKHYSKPKLIFWKVYKFLSFRSNLKYLIAIKNKYYDDSEIEYISFFRFLLLFWFIFNHNIYALIKIPHKDFTNYNFFTSIWFTIIKYSAFSSECWIMLDGVIVSYKLMSYLKKYGKEKDSFSVGTFLRFYLISATKISLFLFSFLVLHVYLGEFAGEIKNTPILQYFIENINNKRECQTSPFSIFIPFYIQYCSGSKENPIGFRNCYRFVNILMNEFYCFTFILIIFYLAYAFKSKLFDFTITCLFLINLSLSFLSYGESIPKCEYFCLSYILGETSGYTYTHLFLNTYMIGVFTGLVYFYYNDITSSNPISTDELRYIPFGFTFNIMKFFDRSGKTLLKFYFILSILCQIFISMSFYFYIQFFSQGTSNGETIKNNFNIKVNPLIIFLYIYERKIFLLFFVIMMLSLLLYPKVTSLKHFVQSNLFIPFNRINFACLCILDTCVYLFYSAYKIEIFLNLQNMFLITIGLTVYISVIGTALWLLFELPFRIIYKNLFYREEKKLMTTMRTSN